MLVREGANYRVLLEDGVVAASIWRRPDLTSQEGADAAKELLGTLVGLAREASAKGAILDLREAPPVAGPRTAEHIAEFLAAWARADKRVAIVHGVHPMQVMQVKRLLRENAPATGAPFEDFSSARAWLLG